MHRGCLLAITLAVGCAPETTDPTDPPVADTDAADPTTPPDGVVDDTDVAEETPVDSAAPTPPPAAPTATFTGHLIASPAGPAFVTVDDVDGDGKPDILLSRFGTIGLSIPNGAVQLFTRTGDVTSWQSTTVGPASDGMKFPNHTTVEDLDGDGDLDVIVPSGFLVCEAVPWVGDCGAMQWYENDGGNWIRHVVVEGEQLFYHNTELTDLDGDGITDLVTVAERISAFGPGDAVPQWFRGTNGPDRFESTPRSMGQGLGSFPNLRDIDGDGDMDIASAEYAIEGGSFAWLEQVEAPSTAQPEGVWQRHVINDDVGPSIQLQFVDDLFGDGAMRPWLQPHQHRVRPLESAIYAFEIPDDPTAPWPKTQPAGHRPGAGLPGTPGCAGHLRLRRCRPRRRHRPGRVGDGDRVFWMEQKDGAFEMRAHPDLPQAGGMVVTDLDDDGQPEIIVTGYEDNALYVRPRLISPSVRVAGPRSRPHTAACSRATAPLLRGTAR